MMNIQTMTIFLFVLATSLADILIALPGVPALVSPIRTIVCFISTFPTRMRFTNDIFRSKFTAALIVTKKMFAFCFPIMNSFFSNWFSAVRTRWSAVTSFFFNIFPTQTRSAFIRTSLVIVNTSGPERCRTHRTNFFNPPTIKAKLANCSTSELFMTAITNLGCFSSWHTPIITY